MSDTAQQREALEVEVEQVGQSADRLVARLAALTGPGSENDAVATVARFLQQQNADGSWGSNDYPVLKPVFTAQALQILQQLHIAHPDADASEEQAVSQATQWLTSAQRHAGDWGEDGWDTCQVIKALVLLGASPHSSPVANGLNYIKRQTDQNWEGESSYWFGAGFPAAALEVFNLVSDFEYASKALAQLWAFYDERAGHFLPAPTIDSEQNVAAAEWHTACALIGLQSFGSVVPAPQEVKRAAAWLRHTQHSSGCWAFGHDDTAAYCTIQAVSALTKYDGAQSTEALNGTNWLITRASDTSSRPAGYSVLFMAAAAVSLTHGRHLCATVDFTMVRDLIGTLTRYRQHSRRAMDSIQQGQQDIKRAEDEKAIARQEMARLADDIKTTRDNLKASRSRELELQREVSMYALKLTGNQLAVLSLMLTIVTFVAGTAVALALG